MKQQYHFPPTDPLEYAQYQNRQGYWRGFRTALILAWGGIIIGLVIGHYLPNPDYTMTPDQYTAYTAVCRQGNPDLVNPIPATGTQPTKQETKPTTTKPKPVSHTAPQPTAKPPVVTTTPVQPVHVAITVQPNKTPAQILIDKQKASYRMACNDLNDFITADPVRSEYMQPNLNSNPFICYAANQKTLTNMLTMGIFGKEWAREAQQALKDADLTARNYQ